MKWFAYFPTGQNNRNNKLCFRAVDFNFAAFSADERSATVHGDEDSKVKVKVSACALSINKQTNVNT